MIRAVSLACFLALAPLAGAAAEDEPPVAISLNAIDSYPEVKTGEFKGHASWLVIWPRDADGRAISIGFVEGMRLPYREKPVEMLKFMHDEASEDEAELRRHTEGKAEIIWGLDVFWLVASERAVLQPDPDKPETVAGNRLHRGETRRNCAVFTAFPAQRDGTLIGAYCKELPPTEKLDEATARQWLEAMELQVAPQN